MVPLITLTTDFGAAGPYVAMMKAVIHRHAPGVQIVDLTHEVAPCNPGEAGFWIAHSYRHFPADSLHLAVVDPGVGTSRAIIAAAHDDQLFLAPDNGLLPLVLPETVQLYALAADWPGRRDWPAPSQSFHGSDIFAPLAAALACGRARPADIGPRLYDPVPAALPAARRNADGISGQVVTVDHWGNLITNIDAALLEDIAAPRVSIGHRDLPLRRTYGEAPPGALLALVNSLGVVEIAWREGNAAAMLGLGRGAPVQVSAGG